MVVGWPWIVLLALGVAVVVAAEWPWVASKLGADARRARERERVKATLQVCPAVSATSSRAASRRDLDALPTIDEPTPKR